MWIDIREKLKPFSHEKGAFAIIPGTSFALQAFPCRLTFLDLISLKQMDLDMPFRGSTSEFTIEVDIEKRVVNVFAKEERGYFRFVVFAENSKLYLHIEKLFTESIEVHLQGEKIVISKKDKILIAPCLQEHSTSFEKLFLGITKHPDMQQIAKREDLKEILPLWHAIGAIAPQMKETSNNQGPFKELEILEQNIAEKKTLEIAKNFKRLFLGAINGIFKPEDCDTKYQGLWENNSEDSCCSLAILSRGYFLIRSLFIQEDKNTLMLLPRLLPSFASGKITHAALSCGSLVSIEWTKGKLRRVMIKAKAKRELLLKLPFSTRSFRLRNSPRGKGALQEEEIPLQLLPNRCLYLDHFQR